MTTTLYNTIDQVNILCAYQGAFWPDPPVLWPFAVARVVLVCDTTMYVGRMNIGDGSQC